MVTQRSAKPFFAGSNPVGASSLILQSKLRFQIENGVFDLKSYVSAYKASLYPSENSLSLEPLLYNVGMTDNACLRRAVDLAETSGEEVGCACIIALDGDVIAEEVNSQNIDQIAVNHAEMKALISANKSTGQRKLNGATAYCSCEPCAMCVTALSYAKVARIVYVHALAELFPDDPQSSLDIKEFAANLNFVPKIEQVIV